MAEHSAITDPNIHEPKGVAVASAGSNYIADGAGSGSWDHPYYTLTLELDDISTASTSYVVAPLPGTVEKIYSVIHTAITVADAVLTSAIGGTSITDGSITVAFTGAAAGDVDSTVPSAANTVAAGSVLSIATDGGSTTASRCTVTFLIKRTT